MFGVLKRIHQDENRSAYPVIVWRLLWYLPCLLLSWMLVGCAFIGWGPTMANRLVDDLFN